MICTGAGLWACSSVTPLYVQTDKVEVNISARQDEELEEFIQPYRDSLVKEMNEVIAWAESDFVNARPTGSLGNLVVDQTLDYVFSERLVEDKRYICIMNYGGLRAPIDKGPVTIGDVFRLMPFDNTLVLLKLPSENISELVSFMKNSGGEPIGGFLINENGFHLDDSAETGDTLYVITTDYLAGGGDNMKFLQHPYDKTDTRILIRDILISQFREADTLRGNEEQRIKL
ncbi:MAG: 5'-nucleotidase C-terminal domain-containing protein [Brumimicrobium sp.]|nr:5'-nucleotidase C-terminal domain-containing protein [Brumimicrobium sp.]